MECEDNGEGDQDDEEKEVVEFTTIPERPEISIHALLGSSNPSTMKVIGKVASQKATTLIDSDSTLNFMDTAVAKRSKLSIEIGENVNVLMANGDQLLTKGLDQNVKFCLHGYSFETDLFVIDLVGCDVVVGVQWLKTLGNIA